MAKPEVNQATGSQAQLLYNAETSWGNLRTSGAAWKALRLIGGEGLDQNLAIYQSQEIRPDRFENLDVRGTQDPGGSIPFELAPRGWNPFLYHLLGGAVTTTTANTAAVQTVTVTGPATGGTFTLSFRGKTTTNIAYNALASAVQSALEAMSTVGTGGVTVTGAAPNYTVTFAGSLANQNVDLIEGDGALLTAGAGVTPGVAVKHSVRGLATTTHFKHVMQGGGSLPTGFTLEKGFSGLDSGAKGYFVWLGSRVDSMDLSGNINQIVGGTFDVACRQMLDPAAATVSSGGPFSAPTEDPFTSSQINVLEGSTLSVLGIATRFSLRVSNNFYRDRGFILGSNIRANLKPGRFSVSGDMEVMFKDTALFEKAIAGTSTVIAIYLQSGTYSLDLYLPAAQFMPNNSVPKVPDDGPITYTVQFKGTKGSMTVEGEGSPRNTSLIAVLVVPENAAAITG